MKKLVIVVILVLLCVAGWAGATYVVGKQAEQYYFDLLDQAGQLGFVTLTNQGFERGFLTSRAETLLEVKIPTAPQEEGNEQGGESSGKLTEETVRLIFEHSFHHGPLPYSRGPAGRYAFSPAMALVETRLTRFSPDQAGLENLLEKVPELRETIAIAKIHLNGTTDSLFEVPALQIQMDDGRFDWSGLIANTVYSPRNKTLAGTFAVQNVTLRTDDGGAMTWQGFSGEYDLREALPLLYVGTSRVVVGGMDMTVPDKASAPKTFRMQEMEFAADSRFDGRMMHIDQSMTFDGIEVGADTYGPLIVVMESKNLDGQVLSEFQKQLLDLYRQADTLDPDALAGRAIPLYVDLLTRLLAGNPEFNITRFHITAPKGEVDGTFRLKFAGVPQVTVNEPLELLQYLQYLDVAAEVTVDEGLVCAVMREKMAEQQIEQQLEAFAAQRFVVRDGGKLKSVVTFRRGDLQVNGRPLPVFQ